MNEQMISLEEVEVEIANELLRAHNAIHGTKIKWEALSHQAKDDLEFKARAVMEWIGRNQHRIGRNEQQRKIEQ